MLPRTLRSPASCSPAPGGLPEKLKACRRLHGLSQKQMAALLSVDASTVWHWEQGHSQPTDEHAERINALIATLEPQSNQGKPPRNVRSSAFQDGSEQRCWDGSELGTLGLGPATRRAR